jgi:hypothetical protein
MAGRSAAMVLWQPMHNSTLGIPGEGERSASLWQYRHCTPACTITWWLNAIGWTGPAGTDEPEIEIAAATSTAARRKRRAGAFHSNLFTRRHNVEIIGAS